MDYMKKVPTTEQTIDWTGLHEHVLELGLVLRSERWECSRRRRLRSRHSSVVLRDDGDAFNNSQRTSCRTYPDKLCASIGG